MARYHVGIVASLAAAVMSVGCSSQGNDIASQDGGYPICATSNSNDCVDRQVVGAYRDAGITPDMVRGVLPLLNGQVLDSFDLLDLKKEGCDLVSLPQIYERLKPMANSGIIRKAAKVVCEGATTVEELAAYDLRFRENGMLTYGIMTLVHHTDRNDRVKITPAIANAYDSRFDTGAIASLVDQGISATLANEYSSAFNAADVRNLHRRNIEPSVANAYAYFTSIFHRVEGVEAFLAAKKVSPQTVQWYTTLCTRFPVVDLNYQEVIDLEAMVQRGDLTHAFIEDEARQMQVRKMLER